MRIAYVSTDEVNHELAVRIASRCGVDVCKRLPNDPAPVDRFDAVVYNLDDVPRDERSALLDGIRLGKPGHPTAVHGYDLTDLEASNLNRNGVAVARRLQSNLLRRLISEARQNRQTVLSASAGTDLTWVNLA